MSGGRNSLGPEINPSFEKIIKNRFERIVNESNECIDARIRKHLEFVKNRETAKKPLKYKNKNYGFKVMTGQETGVLINRLKSINSVSENEFEVGYSERMKKIRQVAFVGNSVVTTGRRNRM